MPDSQVPYPKQWKRDYLELEKTIKEFRAKYDATDHNVGFLLQHHLYHSCEMLLAEVNGGLDEVYQDEVDQLKSRPAR